MSNKTPKEKAKELVEKFENDSLGDLAGFKGVSNIRCALICVDEVLKVIPSKLLDDMAYLYINEDVSYWEQVKKEIELLWATRNKIT